MKSSEASAAQSVLDQVLVQVRREKSRRHRRRMALAAVLPLLALAAGGAAWQASSRPQAAPLTVAAAIPAAEPVERLEEERSHETIAILVMRDGYPSLEERDTHDLADLDLTFTLDPVLAQAR